MWELNSSAVDGKHKVVFSLCIGAVCACSGRGESLKPRVLVIINISPPVRWRFRTWWFRPGHGHVAFRAGIRGRGSGCWSSRGWGFRCKAAQGTKLTTFFCPLACWPALGILCSIHWPWRKEGYWMGHKTEDKGKWGWGLRKLPCQWEEDVLLSQPFFREKEGKVEAIYQMKGSVS